MIVPSLFIRDLKLDFAGGAVFEHLDMDLPAGQCTVLLGPSGVGKTSLLRIIAGLQPAAAGTVAAADAGPLSGRMAYMAQQDLLLPWARALDNISLGARLRGAPVDLARAENLLARVGLAHRAQARPAELSGGERQRLALARTLYEDRPVVLMDEPFSALDAITRASIQALAAELLAGRTVLLITHDPLEACRLGHQIFVLAGAPAKLGPPITLGSAPPRAADASLLATQAELLARLAA